jgi:photosystem II stability/assembly factor-like uncharacterized protein
VNRFERVIEILDAGIGGPDVEIGVHGAFWRVKRDQFIEIKVFGDVGLVVVGQGAASNIIKALKGEEPFDGSPFPRMPVGGEVPAEDIAFIERWIDDGCPEDEVGPTPQLTWRPLGGDELVARRYDDVFFLTPELGWAVNSDAEVWRTADGGATWGPPVPIPGAVYLRCIGFATETRGWVGTISPGKQLFEPDDGGLTWRAVTMPSNAPSLVCGLSVVTKDVVYAAGTNHNGHRVPNRESRVMTTEDGGASWRVFEMGEHASLLVDIHFKTPEVGWVVGGKTQADPGPEPPDRPGCNPAWRERWDVKPVVLYTEDGGATWVDRASGVLDECPLGEWGWKINWMNDKVGFVSLENFFAGAILKTTDGGMTWQRLAVNDAQGNANLDGVGFVDAKVGWVGGWGSCDMRAQSTSATTDGGKTWHDANQVGRNINRFRFFGNPVTVGYACGQTLYKYSAEPPPAANGGLRALAPPGATRRLLDPSTEREVVPPVRLAISVPEGAAGLTVDIWDPQFGDHVRRVVDEATPRPGARTVEWDGTDDSGRPVGPGSFVFRTTVDDRTDSCVLWVGRP